MKKNPCRRGIAIVTALVIMAVLTVLLSVVTLQILAQRNVIHQRHRQLQAEWLARAGVELAAARLLASPAPFNEDNGDLSPNGKVRIVVEKAAEDSFLVSAEAVVGDKEKRPVSRSASRRFRRSDNDGVIKLQAVEEEKKKGP